MIEGFHFSSVKKEVERKISSCFGSVVYNGPRMSKRGLVLVKYRHRLNYQTSSSVGSINIIRITFF